MPRSVMPFFEEKPYYMSVMGMQGARFIEGNDGTGSGDSGESNSSGESEGSKDSDNSKDENDESNNSADEDSTGGDEGEGESNSDKSDEDFKSEESKKAVLADLRKARDERKAARDEVDVLIASVAERDATIVAKDAEIESLKAEAQVSALAATHGIVDEADVELLASITDSEKRTKLAERLATDARNRVNRRVGSSGNGMPAGSLDAGRDLYESRKK